MTPVGTADQPAVASGPLKPILLIGLLVLLRLVLVAFSLIESERTGVLPARTKTVIVADATRFREIAQGHGTPYRDFRVEYPPVSLGVIELVGAAGGVGVIDDILALIGI